MNNTAVSGGAVENVGDSAPAFANCLFQGNDALLLGGAMDNDEADPKVASCRFFKNSALDGGAVYNGIGSNVSFSHCVFWGNLAEARGAPGMVRKNSPLSCFNACSLVIWHMPEAPVMSARVLKPLS